MGMDVVLRGITREELSAYVKAAARGFGEAPMDEQGRAGWIGAELERVVAAFDGDELVANGRCYSLELTVPGGRVVPVGGVSWISTLPTHRRRGILRQMMARLHDDARERGEPAAILTASEGGIYSRFGYGIATRVRGIEIDRRDVRFARPTPDGFRVRFADPEADRAACVEVFERVRRTTVGAVSRSEAWWASEQVDPGQGPRFDVVVDGPDGPAAFAAYHITGRWHEGVADKTLLVRDLVADGPAPYHALWHYLCGVDQIRTIGAWALPADDPLPWLFVDPRAVRTTSWRDFLWARPLDVAVALAARTYSVEGRVVLEVHDPFPGDGAPDAAEGRFALDGGPAGATCTRTDAEPDLVLDVNALGAIWLGGVRPSTLAAGGRIASLTPALALTDRMFAADHAPRALTWF